MNLSKNLTLDEAIITQAGFDNTPGMDHEIRLFYLAQYLFQPTRDRWGPIRITSGYRSPHLNMAVGGATTSQHCRGEALDVIPIKAETVDVYEWIIDTLTFGQAIFESVGDRKWIHISLPRLNGKNMQCLSYNGERYAPYR